MNRQQLNALVSQVSADHQIPIALLAALIKVESDWDVWAWNPEPHYRWLWNVKTDQPFRPIIADEIKSERPPADFPCFAGDPDQEWWGQQASWGLVQIMGAVARECGFSGLYLPQLLDPRVNLEFGCGFLNVLRKRHFAKHGWNGVLSAWNTGSPAYGPWSSGDAYVNKIRAAGWKG